MKVVLIKDHYGDEDAYRTVVCVREAEVADLERAANAKGLVAETTSADDFLGTLDWLEQL